MCLSDKKLKNDWKNDQVLWEVEKKRVIFWDVLSPNHPEFYIIILAGNSFFFLPRNVLILILLLLRNWKMPWGKTLLTIQPTQQTLKGSVLLQEGAESRRVWWVGTMKMMTTMTRIGQVEDQGEWTTVPGRSIIVEVDNGCSCK